MFVGNLKKILLRYAREPFAAKGVMNALNDKENYLYFENIVLPREAK